MPEAGEYTIGWICALTKELIAAKAFLDVLHDPIDNAAINDDNNYTLGSIGKHNVVIAVLPYGQYGLVNAAAALKDMTRTFSNLRVVLMVGIGGGVPGTKDIRLGDIVVGSVGRNSSGVIQYDYGRAVQGEEFAVTGHLNQPPMAFLTAMSALHATYQMEGHSIESNIGKALQRYKRLSKKYKRPAPSTDRLYKAEAIHQGGEGIVCSSSCGDDNLVHRDERDEDENNAAIHCGLIASASSLIKDALLRDKLAAKHGILCFEMEAAGLMNHFPCVVIRGICDYSDSHKNDEWQEYAAMVAAAYTKDLLLRVAPSSVKKEERIKTLLGQLNHKVEDIRHIAMESNHDIKSLSSIVYDDSISAWLDPTDPSVDHNKAREICHSGTGRWLLDSPQYVTWKSQENSFLWLNGSSGQGKSILSSTVIEDVRNSPPGNSSTLYFYITFTDHRKQSLEAILRSLINQLYRSGQKSRFPIASLYSKCGGGSSQATVGQLRSAFREMLSAAGEMFIIIDALDEYQNRSTQRDELLSWIQGFYHQEVKIHLLVTSRPEHDIKACIETWAHPDSIISLQKDNVGRDISGYVRDVLANSTGFRRWHGHASIQDDIVNILTKKADGLFRWVTLQLERLEGCISKEEVNTTLHTLPTTLQATYFRVLAELTGIKLKYVIRILQFLAYSDIPIELEAAVDALAINLTAPPGSRFIMKELGTVFYRTSSWFANFIEEEDPLFYASWSGDPNCVKRLIDSTAKSKGDSPAWKLGTALRFAAIFGRIEAAALLVQGGADVNGFVEGERLLASAVRAGHIDIIALMVKQGADVNAQQGSLSNPLSIAARSGRLHVVEFLVKHGADANGHPLYHASRHGHLSIAMHLVKKGANVNAQEGHCSALQIASICGHMDIVTYLINQGADVDAQGPPCGTALCAASYWGRLDIVKHLVESGADVNADVLYAASFSRDLDVIVYLENIVAENAIGGDFEEVLKALVSSGRENVAKALVVKFI
ncbi:ankyrin repeat L25 [Fusarium circinatum]|uniref:Ankyrin repeat L25 n=1 Tax=Fusarium circinatum TaxID=48490 RepID=A0A8H5TRC0_FUSCI|nr:ankyrin repeat L25 [Fusarium circinatum]